MPDITISSAGDQLISDLEEMIPRLRERSLAAEEAGRIPEETIQELKDIGVFRAFVPASYGGMEVPLPYVPKIFSTLGRGCSATAWTMGFLIYHNYQFAHYPKKAQDETFGAKGYTMAAGQVVPGGEAKRVDGGFILDGRWGYASGILHCDYMAIPAPVVNEPGPDGKPNIHRFYVAQEEFEIHDTWHVAAMRASGSHDVSLTDVFVPEHQGLAVSDLREGTSPGLELNKGPLYRVPVLTFMVFGTVGPMIGAAQAMLELVTDILKTKVGAYSGERQQELQSQRVRLARIEMELDATLGLFHGTVAKTWATVSRGDSLTREERVEARMVVSHTAQKCHQIVDELAVAAGSRGYYLDSPIQRFQRDTNMLATHAIFEFDHVANLYGGTLLGLDVPDNAMI